MSTTTPEQTLAEDRRTVVRAAVAQTLARAIAADEDGQTWDIEDLTARLTGEVCMALAEPDATIEREYVLSWCVNGDPRSLTFLSGWDRAARGRVNRILGPSWDRYATPYTDVTLRRTVPLRSVL